MAYGVGAFRAGSAKGVRHPDGQTGQYAQQDRHGGTVPPIIDVRPDDECG